MSFVNLTPHEINLFDEDGNEVVALAPTGDSVRIETERQKVGEADGVPIFEVEFGEVNGLPEPNGDDIFIVGGFVNSHPEVSERDDVMSPGELIRDSDGNPVGAKGLVR